MHVDLGFVSQLTVASWRHMGTYVSVDGGSDNARQPQPITWTNVDLPLIMRYSDESGFKNCAQATLLKKKILKYYTLKIATSNRDNALTYVCMYCIADWRDSRGPRGTHVCRYNRS